MERLEHLEAKDSYAVGIVGVPGMHDGAIIHDEKTALGRVANTARKVLYTLPTKEDSTLAGVSALMKGLPAPPAAPKKSKPKKAAKTKVRRKKS